ncbi:MAG: GNAT family N-acetyltransferase [Trebonia sp.]
MARVTRTRLTRRLRLSPAGPWHAGDLWRLHYDEAVAAWYAGRYTVAMAQSRATAMAEGWDRDGTHRWMACHRADGSLVGRGGVSRRYIAGAERYEVGWTVRPDLWGRGYATEIGAAGLAFAFGDLGVEEVAAFTGCANRRSRAVMERLGLRYIRAFPLDGYPFVLYAITRAEHARPLPAPLIRCRGRRGGRG